MHRCSPHACAEYNALSRRHFLAATGGVAAMAVAPAWLPRVAYARDHRGTQRDVIISIYLRGAADGLSLVPPYGETEYFANRPTTAVPHPDSGDPERAIPLDGFFGLAPALAPLMPAYGNDHLLFVHACGSTDSSRSHFEAQAFMEVGKPRDPTINTGWLGRHLYSVAPMDPDALLRAVGIGSALPRTLFGGPYTVPISNLDTYNLSGSGSTRAARRAAISDMHVVAGPPLDAIAQNNLATIDLLNTIDFAGYIPAGGAAYPSNSFGTALKSTAALIKAQVGVEAVAINLDGWDTHSEQGTTGTGDLARLMGTLSQGLAALYADMTAGQNPGFTVVAMSEFGRELRENGSLGTDHGHGGVMMVMGQCVAGGRVLTQWPGLAPEQLYQDRDLDVTIDFRDVLAEIVQQRLGNSNLAYVFPDFTPTPRGIFAC